MSDSSTSVPNALLDTIKTAVEQAVAKPASASALASTGTTLGSATGVALPATGDISFTVVYNQKTYSVALGLPYTSGAHVGAFGFSLSGPPAASGGAPAEQVTAYFKPAAGTAKPEWGVDVSLPAISLGKAGSINDITISLSSSAA